MPKEELRKDLLREAETARGIEFPPGAEELGLASSFVYAQVLHALWDSGFYEYVRAHPRFAVERAVEDLALDPATFRWLLYYLVGRGVMRCPVAGEMELTDKGRRVTNTIARGLLNLY